MGEKPYYTLPRLRKISRQVLEALRFIHSLNLLHCDIKPENIVIKSYSRCEVKLIDFGSSCFTSDNLTTYIQSRSYRAPEVIIGHPYDSRIDVWSLGAVIAELHAGYVLFQNDSLPCMLSRISGILGPYPEHVLANGSETSKYFTLSNVLYEMKSPGADDESGDDGDESAQRDDGDEPEAICQLIYPKRTSLAARLHLRTTLERIDDEELLFLDFITATLNLDCTQRVTAAQALGHRWLEIPDDVPLYCM